MSVRRARVLVSGVALAFVLALGLGATGLAGSARAYAAGTTLSVLSGEVQVRHAGGDFANAADGDQLREGDTIRTGDGRAVLTYFEGSTVTVEPNSEITIDATTTASDGGTVVLMTQVAGRTWHVVTKLIAGGSRYEVRTPASTASVRGTEFEVDADADATTVTTTEGVVVQHVPDASLQGAAVDVPVTAGTTQTQHRNAPAAPAAPKATPQRTVTVSVAAANTIVVDPLGRANGVTRDGRVVVQTPGAQVRRVDGQIVVTMPDLPDGTLAARVDDDPAAGGDVAVTTTIAEQGRSVVMQQHAKRGTDTRIATGVDIRRVDDGVSDGSTTDDTSTLPTAHVPANAGSHRPLAPTSTDAGTRATLSPGATATDRGGVRSPDASARITNVPERGDSQHPAVVDTRPASARPTATIGPASTTGSAAGARADGSAQADRMEDDGDAAPAGSPPFGGGFVVNVMLPTLAPASPPPSRSR